MNSCSIKRAIFPVTGRGSRFLPITKANPKETLPIIDKPLIHFVKNILPSDCHCHYVEQTQLLGLGQAILCAKPLVGQEPFAVLLADDLLDEADPSCLQTIIQAYQETQQYSIVDITTSSYSAVYEPQGIMEKLTPDKPPSLLNSKTERRSL